MPENPNVAALKAGYAKWHESRGQSTDHWLALLADHVDFRSLGAGHTIFAFADPKKTREEVVGYFKGLTDQFAMEYYRIDHYIADGDRVAAVGATAWRHKATGKLLETPKVDVFRFENGRIVEFCEYFDTAAALAAATPD